MVNPRQQRTSEQEARDARRRFRTVVADVVGALRSQEINRSFASISLEEVIDRQIERIEGAETETKPNRLTRVNRIKAEFDGVIDAIKETDPDLFRPADPDDDANTPQGEEGT